MAILFGRKSGLESPVVVNGRAMPGILVNSASLDGLLIFSTINFSLFATILSALNCLVIFIVEVL